MSALILIWAFVFLVGQAEAQLSWPVEPTNSDHPIGNCFGEYQQYANSPAYLHNGIDIREDCAPNGPWVSSVTGGAITLYNPYPNDPGYRYNGITIVTGNTTYRYWHLDHNSITNDVLTAVNNSTAFPANTRISQIVDWTSNYGNFHHLHFCIETGGNYQNPFSEGITPENDNIKPEIDKILICRNNSNTFLQKPARGCWVVNGDLDIIAKASDQDPPLPAINWQGNIGIYRIEYFIKELTGTGNHNVPTTELYRFDQFPTAGNGSNEASIIYKDSTPADSQSDYWEQNGETYYYIVTNVDNKGNLDEQNGCWNTDGGGFPDGLYQIIITAYDFVGNSYHMSDIVYVRNSKISPVPVEVYIRDRIGDNGTIPSNLNGEAFWASPDIRVDAPPFGQVNATGLPFGNNSHDNPIYNQENRIYVRVHNIGCGPSGPVRIRLYWADPARARSASDLNEIDPKTNKVIVNIPPGASVEYSPPILWKPPSQAIGRRCLFVRLESTRDPVMNDYNVPGENNIAMKIVRVINPSPGASTLSAFLIKNPL